MRKRSKAVCPVLCLTLIVVGGAYIYESLPNEEIGGEHAASQACDDARSKVSPNLASPDGAQVGMRSVLADCERKNK